MDISGPILARQNTVSPDKTHKQVPDINLWMVHKRLLYLTFMPCFTASSRCDSLVKGSTSTQGLGSVLFPPCNNTSAVMTASVAAAVMSTRRSPSQSARPHFIKQPDVAELVTCVYMCMCFDILTRYILTRPEEENLSVVAGTMREVHSSNCTNSKF